MDWRHFTPRGFEYDFVGDKLAAHHVSFDEAVQTFRNSFEVRRNKKFKDRFQLSGTTDGGRKLKIIFQLKPDKIVRIITGWDL